MFNLKKKNNTTLFSTYSKNKRKLFYNSDQKGDVLLFINVLFVPKVCVMLHQQNISHFIIHFNIFKR